MRRLALLAASALLIIGGAAYAQEGHGHKQGGHAHEGEAAKEATLVGEVLDLTCFMQHPDDAVGMDHAKCARACINKGLPVGFLAEDGTVYLVIGTGHDPVAPMVADVTGKQVTIKGTVVSHHGVKAIQLAAVTK